MDGLEHDPGDAQLLAVARNHDLLVDALVLAADKVAVQVDVAIEELLATRQRHIGEDVVHIEGVARQRHAAVAQHLRAVEQRVHEQVLVDAELAHLVPGEDATLGKHATVAHGLLRVVFHMLVNVVRDEQVDDLAFGNQGAHIGEQRLYSVAVNPVVGVDDLVVHALRGGKAREHRGTVATVGLMHGTHDTRTLGLPGIGLRRRVVFLGAVVDDDDLEVLLRRAGVDDALNALVHIGCRVVAGNGKRDELFHRRDLLFLNVRRLDDYASATSLSARARALATTASMS